MKRNKKFVFFTIFASLLLVATIFLTELMVTFLLNSSFFFTKNLLIHFRPYYKDKDRKIIQYLPECAIYDSELAYTLKPGKCHIKNREFGVDYLINSAGMRDDEASLVSPQIVVAGDSHAMGWGVNQDLIFPSLLEKKLNKPALNAAISSYGTVRELKILERVNLDELKFLIIQYCDNDFKENCDFQKNSNRLPIMSEEKYKMLCENHRLTANYYWGKHSRCLFQSLTKRKSRSISPGYSRKKEKDRTTEEVDAFLNAIQHSNINLTDVVIIVIEINAYNRNDSLFINNLNERISDKNFQSVAKSIKTIDSSKILGDDAYFVLDDHMNNVGHRLVAQAIAKLIPALHFSTNLKNGH